MRWSSVISVILVFVVFALAGIANAAVNIQTPTNGTTINSLSVNFSFIPMGVNYSLFNCRIFVYGAGNTLYGNLSVAGVNNNTTASATWTATSNDNFIWNVTCINATGPEILTSGTYQFSINYTPPSSGSNGTISGYVLAADNSTIPNANVSISYPVYLSTTSDINGFYNFSSLNYTDPGTQYNISAQRPLNNSTYTPIYSILLNSTNYTIPQNLSFTQQDQQQANGTNGSISGYVFYQNGTAAANVTLSLSGPAVNWTLSNNSTGYYQFSNIFWPANYTVQAMGMGQLGNLSSPSLNNLNLNSGNYNLTGQNLTLQSSMDGQCQPGANWWVSGYAIDSATGLPIVNETLNINF
ncbi:MAG TPA: carboxypeptidase-like regulatory domain-containing protein, partial [Candidatus Micrarchaeota archaeon]|nr:carboxypeptidase-like regulatory domain-containing protein [Candidatus Micrarchaeota archaeon]